MSEMPRIFAVKGIVKSIERENGQAIIQHEQIPDYMEAMTMPFRARQTNAFENVNPGDAVSFRLFVTDQESWIEQVVPIKLKSPGQAPLSPEPVSIPRGAVADSKRRHPLLDYAFTNELGQPVRLSQFRGQALAITFIFTRCPVPDYCPRLSRNFEEASCKLREMSGAPTNWHFLSVSIDPDFDRPSVLKAYAERLNYDPSHWSFFTGPADKIRELATLSDVKYEGESGVISHNLRTLIIDPNGRLTRVIPIGGNLSDLIVNEIVKACGTTQLARHP